MPLSAAHPPLLLLIHCTPAGRNECAVFHDQPHAVELDVRGHLTHNYGAFSLAWTRAQDTAVPCFCTLIMHITSWNSVECVINCLLLAVLLRA